MPPPSSSETVLDPDRFPVTARFLERLPAGVHSHPQCLVKASVLRDVVDSKPLAPADLECLPQEVVQLVVEPRPLSAWIPEVHALTAMLAVRDLHFAPGTVGLKAYERWTRERNRRLLGRPLYRALFLLLSPTRLLRGVGRRWSMFRQGSTLEMLSQEPGKASLQVVYPSFLFDDTVARGLTGALVAATELAGGREAEVEIQSVAEQRTKFEIRWK